MTQRDGVGREVRGDSGLETCVHPWWIHVDVWQNQYNIVKLKKKEYTELYKKELHDPDNHDGVITHLEADILKLEVKWALGRSSVINAKKWRKTTEQER